MLSGLNRLPRHNSGSRPIASAFRTDEQPEFRWQVEAEIAASVLCPLHGLRFKVVLTRFLYRAARFYRSDMEAGCPHRSVQYQRAVRVSFDPNLWPANEEDAPGADALHGCVLVLRDGTRLLSGKPGVGCTQLPKAPFIDLKGIDLEGIEQNPTQA